MRTIIHAPSHGASPPGRYRDTSRRSALAITGLALALLLGLPRPGAAQAPASPLHAELIAHRRVVRFDPALRDPAFLRRVQALEHPDTVRFDPDAGETPLEVLLAAIARGVDPATLSRRDLGPLVSWHAQRQQLLREAEARYRAVFGERPRELPAPPPPVDLALRIHNRGAAPIHIRGDGDSTRWRMRLTGPAAHHVLGGGDPTEIFMVGRLVTIPPGGYVDLPIRELRYGDRPSELAAYWTAPGTYRLHVAFDTVYSVGTDTEPTSSVRLRPTPIELVVR